MNIINSLFILNLDFYHPSKSDNYVNIELYKKVKWKVENKYVI